MGGNWINPPTTKVERNEFEVFFFLKEMGKESFRGALALGLSSAVGDRDYRHMFQELDELLGAFDPPSESARERDEDCLSGPDWPPDPTLDEELEEGPLRLRADDDGD